MVSLKQYSISRRNLGKLVILNPKMTVKEQILILRNPNKVQTKDIKRWLKARARDNLIVEVQGLRIKKGI